MTQDQQARNHQEFSRLFKAVHDEDTWELLYFIKKTRDRLFVHGVNPAEADALLEKHGVKR